MKDSCSKHKKEVAAIADMKELAELIGDLHYETLTEFMRQLAIKINHDGVKDWKAGRKELARHLYFASDNIQMAWNRIDEAWLISKKFMQP